MLTVTLSGLRFHAPIGLYPQEQILHNEIEIRLSVTREAELENLPLINYEVLYTIVSKEATRPEPLLEHLLQRIAAAVTQVYPDAGIALSIRKLHPPFGGRAAYAEVKWETP